MPKISQAQREHQAARILEAAAECFARNGFHATSMDEVIAAAGVSSSTVYRYFPDGKRSLIRAVSNSRMRPLVDQLRAMAEGEVLPSPEDAFVDALAGLGLVGAGTAGNVTAAAKLAVNAWAEGSRDSEVSDLIRGHYAALRVELVRLVRRWIDAGTLGDHLPAEEWAALIQQAAFGLVVEQVVTGRADVPAAALRLGQLFALTH